MARLIAGEEYGRAEEFVPAYATPIRLPPRFDAPEFVLQRLFVAARLLAIARTAHEIPDFRQE